jgi:hypothetical protein
MGREDEALQVPWPERGIRRTAGDDASERSEREREREREGFFQRVLAGENALLKIVGFPPFLSKMENGLLFERRFHTCGRTEGYMHVCMSKYTYVCTSV